LPASLGIFLARQTAGSLETSIFTYYIRIFPCTSWYV